ncbi:MAG: ABC transporter ATP-binding protein [Chloroflexota bacterium]|nr:MAG: ABC transporter ATP-binding protein [Chloroflexota bacterium]
MNGLEIVNIIKKFGRVYALDGISLEIPPGEIIALLGPSGSGKSTLLYVIAGLEIPDSGDIRWDGSSLAGVAPHLRNFGMMFQDFALFPHMDVFDNVAFGLRMAGMERDEIRPRVTEMLELVGLAGFDGRDVNTLSVGALQREKKARSLAPHPRLLMLDEPLGSLDRNLRERLILELRDILKRMQQTAIYVTHDLEEAFTLADKVVVLNAGKIEQVGQPQEIYNQPASLFVARFVGLGNLLPGRVIKMNGKTVVDTTIGQFPVQSSQDGEVTVLIRPDSMNLDANHGSYTLEGYVVDSTFRGSTCRVVVEVGGENLTFDFLSSVEAPGKGEKIRLSFNPDEAIRLIGKPPASPDPKKHPTLS